MKRVYFLYYLLLILPLSSQAEEALVSANFRVLLWPDQAATFSEAYRPREQVYKTDPKTKESYLDLSYTPPPIYYFENGASTAKDLELFEGQLSPSLHYHGPRQLRFYFKKSTEEMESDSPVASASVLLPSSSNHLILVFIPDTPTSYKIYPINFPAEGLPVGSNMVCNLTTKPLMCTMGDGSFNLSSGGASIIEAKSVDEFYHLILVASLSDNGKWRRKIMRKFPNTEQSSLFFIYSPSQSSKELKLMRVLL